MAVDRCKHWWYRKLENNELGAPTKWAGGERCEKAGYFSEIVAEEESRVPAFGRLSEFVYVPRPGIPNEALDCAVYAFAALRHKAVRWDLVKTGAGKLGK